jgi:hypothetical protein
VQTIENDVCTKRGIFYYDDLPANEEIQARFDLQRDFRPIVKDGVCPIPTQRTLLSMLFPLIPNEIDETCVVYFILYLTELAYVSSSFKSR